MKKWSVLTVFVAITMCTSARQGSDTSASFPLNLSVAEDSLSFYLDSMRKSKADTRKTYWNLKFKRSLEKALELPGAFEYPFDSLKTVGKLVSPDNAFRIFNWNIEKSDFTQLYYAFMLIPANKKQKVIELKDMSPTMSNPENQVCDQRKWFGCLYFDIIVSKEAGKKEYTLLGLDLNDRASKKRIIESLTLSGDKVQLGIPIFTVVDEDDPKKKKLQRRIIFEYSSEVQMALKYHHKEKRIVFDHLSPIEPKAKGIRSYYVPDGSYDALLLQDNGKWDYQLDADVRGKKTRIYNDPRKQ